MPVGTAPVSVFDADLPTLTYEQTETPAQIYPRIQAAQQLAPIALGPYGPEVLSYDLVRSVLRDTRFQIPPGLTLAAQGITSGRCGTRWSTPCWAWKAPTPPPAQPDRQGIHPPSDRAPT